MHRATASNFFRTFAIYIALLLAAGAVATFVQQVVNALGFHMTANTRAGVALLLFVGWLSLDKVRAPAESVGTLT